MQEHYADGDYTCRDACSQVRLLGNKSPIYQLQAREDEKRHVDSFHTARSHPTLTLLDQRRYTRTFAPLVILDQALGFRPSPATKPFRGVFRLTL